MQGVAIIRSLPSKVRTGVPQRQGFAVGRWCWKLGRRRALFRKLLQSGKDIADCSDEQLHRTRRSRFTWNQMRQSGAWSSEQLGLQRASNVVACRLNGATLDCGCWPLRFVDDGTFCHQPPMPGHREMSMFKKVPNATCTSFLAQSPWQAFWRHSVSSSRPVIVTADLERPCNESVELLVETRKCVSQTWNSPWTILETLRWHSDEDRYCCTGRIRQLIKVQGFQILHLLYNWSETPTRNCESPDPSRPERKDLGIISSTFTLLIAHI